MTGIGTYAKELIRHLLTFDTENNYTVFFVQSPFQRRRLYFPKTPQKKVLYKSITAPYGLMKYLWNSLNICPIEFITGSADIVHSVDRISPKTKKAKIVTTMLDMIWYDSEFINNKEGTAAFRQIMDTMKRSSGVITCSDFSKYEILNKFNFLKDKIHVIPLGVSDRYRVIEKNELNYRYDNRYPWKEFILYVGLLDEKRKNVERIVSAYAKLKKESKIKEKLLLLGKFFRPSPELTALIKRINLPDDIILYTKWLPDEDMPLIYNKAKLVLLPSLYEGFGLPVIESFACGTPVITSNISPMKEIAQDAALLVNPEDEEELAGSIENILSDDVLYNELVKKGLERRKNFNWEKTACETIRVYESCFK